MQLKDFYDYKNKLIEDIVTTPEIVRLINDDVPFANATDLIYTQVFPFEFLPETTEMGKTYVCVEVDIYESVKKPYLVPTIYVWVFTHKSLLRLPEGGVRTDALCSAICERINGSMMYGLGQLELFSSKRFAPMSDFNGKCLSFRATEFNRFFDGKKTIPANRKQGE